MKKIGNFRSNPVFMDGLSTTKTYAVLATMPDMSQFNCVCVRKLDSDFKLKFYPTAAAWGFDPDQLVDARGFRGFLRRTQTNHYYDRFYVTQRQILQLLNELRERDGVACVSAEKLEALLENWDSMQQMAVYLEEVTTG